MIRSAVIPSNEFEQVKVDVVNDTCEKFYTLFQQLFGVLNCPYNLHVICCHLLEIRTHGPLTATSAFKFESFYGEMRRSFVPGTCSPLKQILKNVLLKRILRNHLCENNIYVSNYETALERNNLIYTYENKKYDVYEVQDIAGNIAKCQKVGQYPVSFPETPNLDWSTVGVFKKGGLCSDVISIQTSQIDGKVLLVDKYLITCPKNVLNEK